MLVAAAVAGLEVAVTEAVACIIWTTVLVIPAGRMRQMDFSVHTKLVRIAAAVAGMICWPILW